MGTSEIRNVNLNQRARAFREETSMADSDIREMLTDAIRVKVLEAINQQSDIIDKLVTAAIMQPVDHVGDPKGWHGKQPFLHWLVGHEIQHATQLAVQQHLREMQPRLRELVAAGLTREGVIDGVVNSIVAASTNEWDIKVSFEAKREDR